MSDNPASPAPDQTLLVGSPLLAPDGGPAPPGTYPPFFPGLADLTGHLVEAVTFLVAPTIGRIVHYYDAPPGAAAAPPVGQEAAETAPPVVRGAFVTDVHNPGEPESVLSLAVFTPTGLFFAVGVYYSPTPQGGCWGWPPFGPPVPGAD